jgi:hypothetical protein
MKTSRVLILTIVLMFVLACSISLGGKPTAVPPVEIPPTQAALPTYTPYPTYTPVPSATLEPTAVATPTLSVKILPDTEKIEIGKSVVGDTMQGAKTWYFIGNQGDVVDISMSGSYPYFFLHDQDNKSLRGCDEAGSTVCALVNFTLPYTGVYYLITEQREDTHWEWWWGSQRRFRGGPFTLNIEPKP